MRFQSCGRDSTTTIITELVITSLVYAPNARSMKVTATCNDGSWPQPCYHYQSAISVNPQWSTLTCPPEAATTNHRENGIATRVWSNQHSGAGGTDKANRPYQDVCDRDEYPPAYLLSKSDPALVFGGVNRNGQLIRYVPGGQNHGAGSMWSGACMKAPILDLNDADFESRVSAAPAASIQVVQEPPAGTESVLRTQAAITVHHRPEFTMVFQNPALPLAGLDTNPCWPSNIARSDPGFALLMYDPFYGSNKPPWNYDAPYVQGANGD